MAEERTGVVDHAWQVGGDGRTCRLKGCGADAVAKMRRLSSCTPAQPGRSRAMGERWPLRARFAHWVVGVLRPWLSLAPYEEPERPDPSDVAYLSGIEAGHREAQEDFWREMKYWDYL